MKEMKRTLSLVLCFVMLVGMLPSFAFAAKAAETPVDALVIFSDLHAMYNGDSSTGDNGYKQTKITSMMTALKENNPTLTFSSVHSAGDAFSSNDSEYTGYTDTITGYIQKVLGDVPVDYLWSDHDRAAVNNATEKKALDKTSHLAYGAGADGEFGTDDDANYYVYYLSMGDLGTYDRYKTGFGTARTANGFTETVAKAIENFQADAAKLKTDRPLFIVSHMPLLDRRNDNGHAYDWAVAINAVAEKMDVAYFFGHNHNYDEKGDYYYAKGTTMPVATMDGFKSYDYSNWNTDLKTKDVKLNFSHICTGYFNPETTGYYGDSRVGTMMVVSIYKDSITYSIQDKNGVYADTDKDGIDEALNVSVKRDHATTGEDVPATTAPVVPETSEPVVTEPVTPETETKTVYVLVDAPVNGGKYLIANDDLADTDLSTDWDDEQGVVAVLSGTDLVQAYVTVQSGEITAEDGETYADGYIELDNANAVWTAHTSGSGLAFEIDGNYINNSSTAGTGTTATAWSYNADTNRLTNSSKYFYFSYNNTGESAWDWKTTSSASGNSTRDIFFYQEVVVAVPGEGGGETPDVPVEPSDVTLSKGGITVKAPGLTALEIAAVTEGAAFEAAAQVLEEGFVAYDIDVAGFVNGSGTATVTIPCAVEDAVVYYISDDGAEVAPMDIISVANGYVTFETDHFTTYAVGRAVTGEWVTITEAVPGATIYAYERVDSAPTSGSYVIVDGEWDRALMNDLSAQEVSTAGSSMTSKVELTQWTFTRRYSNQNRAYNYRIQTGNTSLRYNNGLTTGAATDWYYSDEGESFQIYARLNNGNRYIHFNGTQWQTGADTNVVRLYKRNESADGAETGTPGLYAKITGTTSYTYDLNEMNAEQILAAIKNGITVQYATAYDKSDVQTYADDGEGMSWTWNKPCDGTTAGTYTLTVAYTNDQGTYELGNVTVTINPGSPVLKGLSGSVLQRAGQSSPTGAVIEVKISATETKKIPVTVSMLTKNNTAVSTNETGEITGLTVTYNGQVLSREFTLTVREKVNTPYPEYPEEGAVKVSKTGTGIDFQSTGLARIEISASGVPQKKGVDVIIMLDTSSSMTKNNVTAADGTSKTRAAVLEEALKNLIASLKATDEDGNYMDIKVAIADFNGYYGYSNLASGTPYDRDSTDQVQGGSRYDQGSEAIVYTNGTIRNGSYVANSGTLDATAFLPVQELADSYTLNYTSGTNYDYAFDAIYQLGTAIKVANGEEDRDLVVIFMSDGAALQWNYFTSGHGNDNGSGGEAFRWNKWLAGKWTADDLTTTNLTNTTHSYFYDLNDHDGDGHINEHRMANAIKGSPDDSFEIIRKSTAGLPDGTLTPVMKKDANGNPTNQAYEDLYTVPGLGATMYAINFDAKRDGDIQVDNIDKALASTASDQTGRTKYYYKVTSANELQHAFDTIGSEIAYAANNARFVDQMGPNFNLQLGALKDLNGNKLSGIENTIEVLAYQIYTLEDYENQVITDIHQVGTRKLDSQGNPIATVIERITFSDDGNEVYSNLIGDGKTNILADGTKEGYVKGVIYAQTFYYNTNNNGVALNGVRIPTGINGDGTTTDKVEGGYTDVLPRETFYWRLGTVQTTELAMRYYVYLDGSMEGTREAGAYATNTFATLYYDNYQNQPCYKDTVSPTMAWKSANVSYAFYLVNSEGEVIVNQATGETGSFANKIAITNPVVFHELLLNDDGITLNVVKAMEVLPDYYDPYDMGASYQVFAKSDGTGSWTIGTTESVPTTYVTMYDMSDPAKYTYLNSTNADGVDYTHTVVWFAVELVTQAHPDTVVIDYGLPVDIDVLSNDMFGTLGTVAGVGAVNESLLPGHTTEMNGAFGNDYTGTYGVANVQGNKVRYTLNTSNGMQMQTYEQFMYAVKYSGNVNPGYYYDTITVIPATTIYYEDNFLTYDSFTWDYSSNDWTAVDKNSDKWTWTQIGKVNGVQAEDRPGEYALTDANNIYGYDKANLSMSTYSMGNAMKATVNYDNYAQASFTFWGTGFDLISMTNSATGTILVDVVREDVVGEEYNRYKIVDTYYGYTKQEDGSWVVTPTAQSIWQVPVIKIDDLTYGKYTVTIKASYDPGFDHVDPSYDINVGFYDFYLDAIRIYDPANDGAAADSDTVIEDAYVLDGEGWPSYFELRNHLLTEKSLGNYQVNGENNSKVEVKGVVFIDGNAEVGNAALSEYMSYGPNNEVYLAPGQRVAFILGNVSSNVANIHIGIKSADGKPAQYTFTNIGQGIDVKDGGTGVAAGKWYGAKTETVNTTTDMYYDITAWRGDIIVISNTGDATTGGIISITNIKATYKSNPNGTMVTDETEDPNAGITTASAEDELAGTNEVYAYMTPRAATLTLRALNAPANEEPEQTEPEVPEVTDPVVPETTVPETTVPETTVPETTIPEATEPGNTQLKAAVEAAKKLKEKDYTKESFKAVKDALKAAEKVLKDKKASQAKIDAALDALNAAVEALEAKPSTEALQKAVDEAKKLKEKDYTEESFKEFKKVLKDVEKVLKDKNATQVEIDAALEELNEAVEALEAKPDTAALQKAVDQAKKLKEKDYTKDSFQAVKDALKTAEKVLKDKNATQAGIDEALAGLKAAVEALETKAPAAKPGKPNPKEVVESIVEEIISLIDAWFGGRN